MVNSREIIACGKDVLKREGNSLICCANSLGDTFSKIVELVVGCPGKVVLCGMGKSGHIARKVSATFSSLGTPSFFLHPSEAQHGDLGMVSREDIVIMISNSGETSEILDIIPSLKHIGAILIGIVGRPYTDLESNCFITEIINVHDEAGKLKLAPTVSTTTMLAYGDALAVAAAELNGFSKTDFGRFHPAGTLGKKVLMRVKDIMATGEAVPIVVSGCKGTDAILEMSKKGLGVVAVVDEKGKIKGLLTDGDLRRAIENKIDFYDDIVDKFMTDHPGAITGDLLIVDALEQLRDTHFNNFPVIDDAERVVGMLTWQMIIREGVIL